MPGYTGAIGKFQIDPPQLSTNRVQAGDPVKLQVVIRGEGNFARFTPPVPAPDSDWQVFPPLADANSGSQNPGPGAASFIYTLVPLSDRVTTTPSIAFSAFDPERKAHQALTIPPVPITVQPAPGAVAQRSAESAASSAAGEEADATPVMTGLMQDRGSASIGLLPLQQRGWFLALQLVPAVVLGGLWLWDRRRRFLAALALAAAPHCTGCTDG